LGRLRTKKMSAAGRGGAGEATAPLALWLETELDRIETTINFKMGMRATPRSERFIEMRERWRGSCLGARHFTGRFGANWELRPRVAMQSANLLAVFAWMIPNGGVVLTFLDAEHAEYACVADRVDAGFRTRVRATDCLAHIPRIVHAIVGANVCGV
jgi:hypothetical protein